ncbi:hypothetical protein AMS68_004410 [Peltaster fructicola]|uniref:Postreplication repair E3 ubiquitin-protein ligase RAD18 n=1 Tax=Peltaster fructicola TaxID=286661 RepID=A0A6H0XVW8_9PEZI|nr:hypothetical protein AMS68_004410 [Peltaster fructicola]
MDAAHNIPDSTDWLGTPLAGLSSLENALHCQICKEFFDTPMITSCSHTFCSKCIRTALSTDGCCPACRTQDQASKLRNNWQLQEVVATFVDARPQTIKVAREQQLAADAASKRPGKRKRSALESENSYPEEPVGRTTRSKSRRIVGSQTSQPEVVEVEESEDETFVPEEQIVDDGLVECPLGCGQRMKIEQVEPHLDKCEDEREARERAATSVKKPPMSGRPQDRLNELNYSMMKEKDLSKKLRDLGIPPSGSKQLMMRRHTAWVNIWNANCDSNNPRNKRDLLRDLDTWERTQGGNAPSVPNGIMKKDFDGNGWMKKNHADFSRLVANARRSKVKAAEAKEEKDEEPRDDAVAPVSDPFESSAPTTSEPALPVLASPRTTFERPQLTAGSQPSKNVLDGSPADHAVPLPHVNPPAAGLVSGYSTGQDNSMAMDASQATPSKKKLPMFAVSADSVDGAP